MSIAIWLTRPEIVTGLFRSAVLESEPFGLPYRNVKQWTSYQRAFANHVRATFSSTRHRHTPTYPPRRITHPPLTSTRSRRSPGGLLERDFERHRKVLAQQDHR